VEPIVLTKKELIHIIGQHLYEEGRVPEKAYMLLIIRPDSVIVTIDEVDSDTNSSRRDSNSIGDIYHDPF
jgi:hypothetical protein